MKPTEDGPGAEALSLCRLKEILGQAEQALLEGLLAEVRALFGQKQPEPERVREFFRALEGLSSNVLGPVGYELARLGLSQGRSGLHGIGATKIPLPFGFLAFAGRLEGFPCGGIAFGIRRECFQTREPRLFFQAEELPWGWAPEKAETISRAIQSAGHQIKDVAVRCLEEGGRPGCRVEFTVAKPGASWGSVFLQEGPVPKSILPGPVIQLPLVGEFRCQFGEVTEMGDVVLHRDDFCMK